MCKLPGLAPVARVLVVAALAMFAILIAADLARLDGIRIGSYAVLGRDFVNVWIGGRLAWSGQTGLVYDIVGYRNYLEAILGIRDVYAYSYPPTSLLSAGLFAPLPYLVALALWTTIGVAAFYCAAKPYLAEAGLSPLLALAIPAGLSCIWAGHYGLLIGALALNGWRMLDERPRMAGVMFGLMTIKPHLGILIALVLVIQRRWLAMAYAGLTFGILFVVSGMVFGFESWSVYAFRTLAFHADLLTSRLGAFHSMMPTTTSAMLRLHAPPLLVDTAQIITALFAIGMVTLACRRDMATTDLGLIVSSAVFLVLPYAFNYDMTVVSLAMLIFAARQDHSYSAIDKATLATGFILPLLLGPGRHYVVFGPIILMLTLWVQLKVATATRPVSAPRGVPTAVNAARSI